MKVTIIVQLKDRQERLVDAREMDHTPSVGDYIPTGHFGRIKVTRRVFHYDGGIHPDEKQPLTLDYCALFCEQG